MSKVRIVTIACMCALLAYAFLIEPNWITVTHHGVTQRDQPNKLTIAQVSDLHLHDLGRREQNVINELSRLKPDMIVFSGDVIDRANALPALDDFLKATGDVPKLAVLGNWEHWANIDLNALRSIYDRHGTRLLINQTASFNLQGRRVTVVGLDDYTAGRPVSASSLLPAHDGDLAILVQHSPGMFTEEIAARNLKRDFELCLAGHTHAGQITLFGLALWMPPGSGPYTAGMYATKACPLYVSRGIGTSILPARFGARPEIAVFEF